MLYIKTASHMQNIIQIYPCLLKLSHKQDTILKIVDFSTKNYDFPQNPCFKYSCDSGGGYRNSDSAVTLSCLCDNLVNMDGFE
jgi:hypothetical protein